MSKLDDINEKKRELAWATLISDTIKKQDLYGRSFTAGVALYELASEGWLDVDMESELSSLLEMYVGEDVTELMSARGLSVEARDLVHVVDIATLDDIARQLEGEHEDE